ncbi:PEP-CTERM sorting domain-containing protein, partial [Microcystis aeruginosa BLCCF158]
LHYTIKKLCKRSNVVGGNIILSGTQFARGQLFVTGSPNAFGLNSPLGTLFGTNGVADASSGVLDSNNSTLTFTRATSVPEPGTILGLVTVGALGALARKRKG